MSDFLDGLLARAEGGGAAIQRRRPSLFEPTAGLREAVRPSESSSETAQITEDIGEVVSFQGPNVITAPMLTTDRPAPRGERPQDRASTGIPVQPSPANPSGGDKRVSPSSLRVNDSERSAVTPEMRMATHADRVPVYGYKQNAEQQGTRSYDRWRVATPAEPIATVREVDDGMLNESYRNVDRPPSSSAPNPPVEPKIATVAWSTTSPPLTAHTSDLAVHTTPQRVEGKLIKPKGLAGGMVTEKPPALADPYSKRAAGASRETTPSNSDASLTPTIHVTIGRVEIRATRQPTTATPREHVSPSPRLSLEEYLRQRKGGGR